MPQKFGLYEDLTVQENLDLHADLQGVSKASRRERFARLMTMTGLSPFLRRLSGHLSGGMKQKLGLACALIKSPDFLLLDEPTVGVDPLSRRELWRIVDELVRDGGIGVLVATSYLDEAERCGKVVVMDRGEVLAALLEHVERWVKRFVRLGAPTLVNALRPHLSLLGERVRWEEGRGIFEGIDESGAAKVRTDAGVVSLHAARIEPDPE